VKESGKPMRRLPPLAARNRAVWPLVALCTAAVPAYVCAAEVNHNALSDLRVRETPNATEIVVSGTAPPTFTVFKLADPARLFIDISNADTARLKTPVDIGNGVVGEVTALQFSESGARVGRIIVGLEVDALYKVVALGNDLVVTVDASQRRVKSVPVAGGDSAETLQRLRDLEARAAEADARARAAEGQAADARTQAQRAAEQARAAVEQAKREGDVARAAAEARMGEADASARAAAQAARTEAERARLTAERSRTEAEAARRETEAARAAAATAFAAAEKAKAERVAAEAVASRAVAQAATAQAEAERARGEKSAAEQTARVAAGKAAEAEAQAQQGRGDAKALADARAAAEAAEARRAQAEAAATHAMEKAREADARAQAAEQDRSALKAQLAALDAQRGETLARIAALEGAENALSAQLAQARADNNREATARLEAEQRARAAEVSAQRAEVARLESAKAASALDTRLRALDAELVGARAEGAKGQGKASGLEREAEALRTEAARLKAALGESEQALKTAKSEAQRRRDVADALPGPTPVAVPPVVVAQPVAAAAPTVSAAAKPAKSVRVADVRFQDKPQSTEIRVRIAGEARYAVRQEGERTRILELEGATIDPNMERSLDTSAFDGAVKLVSSFQAPGDGDRVRVVVTLGDRVSDRVAVEGDALVWRFEKPARTRTAPVAQASQEVTLDRASAAVYTGPLQTQGAAAAADANKGNKKKRYGGRKINVDIKDADVHNVLRLLSKEGNVNVVISDKVTGTVTLHLNMVPWDQALDIVLRAKNLDMVREGDIIRVGTAEDLAAERKLELEAQQLKDKLKPLNVKLISINHAVAENLIARIQSVLTERGKVEFDSRTNTVIVKDVDESLEAAEDLVRRLDTQTPQVMIEARIVEVNTNSEAQFGIQWGGDALWSSATGNPTGLKFPSVIGIRGAADDRQAPIEGTSTNPNFIVNMPAVIGSGTGGGLGLTFGSVDGTFNLNVRLSAAESQGQVKIVSSPKVTTLDNKEATISQGVSIPISQVSAAGVNTVFFDAVLKLTVKPHVTQDGNIYLDVQAENNTPDFQNVGARGDPTILKKTAKTNVLLKDGDTTVIGGIYTSNGGFSKAEVPFFARIPILGALFSNYRESDRRTELLIFLTPRIVNRSAASVRTAP